MAENIFFGTMQSDPDGDKIMQIIDGARKLKLMNLALELGIFENLESAQTITAVAERFDFNVSALARFLDVLVAMGLLIKTNPHTGGNIMYQNSQCTSKYLLKKRRPSFVWTAMVSPSLDKLPTFLKYDGISGVSLGSISEGSDDNKQTNHCVNNVNMTANIKETEKKMEKMTMNNNDKNRAQNYDDIVNGNDENGNITPISIMDDPLCKFALATEALAGQCSHQLLKSFDLSMFSTALDLGGGSGLVARHMANLYPDMDVTTYDLPHVSAAARKLCGPYQTDVKFVSGNFLNEDIPYADLYLLVHVIHSLTEDKIDILLRKLNKTMPAGGAILLGEKILNECRDGPEFCSLNDLTMALFAQGSKERTAKEYTTLLEKHGFVNTQIRIISGYNYCDAILAQKPFNRKVNV